MTISKPRLRPKQQTLDLSDEYPAHWLETLRENAAAKAACTHERTSKIKVHGTPGTHTRCLMCGYFVEK